MYYTWYYYLYCDKLYNMLGNCMHIEILENEKKET